MDEHIAYVGVVYDGNGMGNNTMVDDEMCGECDKPWDSEYHKSDECVTPTNEDRPEPQDFNLEYEKIKNL